MVMYGGPGYNLPLDTANVPRQHVLQQSMIFGDFWLPERLYLIVCAGIELL